MSPVSDLNAHEEKAAQAEEPAAIAPNGEHPAVHAPGTDSAAVNGPDADKLGDELSAPSDFVSRMRHTTAHVLAQAVRELMPDAKMGIGPVIENGFYYDFDLPRKITDDDLAALEERMKRIVKENLAMNRFAESRQDARARCEAMGQTYKVRLIDDLPDEAGN